MHPPSPAGRGFAAVAGVAERLQIGWIVAAARAAIHDMVDVSRWHWLSTVDAKRIDAQRMLAQIHEPVTTPTRSITTRVCRLSLLAMQPIATCRCSLSLPSATRTDSESGMADATRGSARLNQAGALWDGTGSGGTTRHG